MSFQLRTFLRYLLITLKTSYAYAAHAYILAYFLLSHPPVFADDIVQCDPTHPLVPNAVTRFETSIDPVGLRGRSGFLIWTAPNNTMSSDEQATMNVLRSQLDALKGVPMTSWICADSDADGLLDSVREMNQTEKDAAEAPSQAARNRQTQLATEQGSNPYCTETFEQVSARIDAISNAMPELREAVKQLARCLATLREQQGR